MKLYIKRRKQYNIGYINSKHIQRINIEIDFFLKKSRFLLVLTSYWENYIVILKSQFVFIALSNIDVKINRTVHIHSTSLTCSKKHYLTSSFSDYILLWAAIDLILCIIHLVPDDNACIVVLYSLKDLLLSVFIQIDCNILDNNRSILKYFVRIHF